MIYRTRNAKIIITFLLALFSSGCASLGPYTVNLADPPKFFIENNINPLEEVNLENNIIPIFYATNREVWEEGESKHFFYKNKKDIALNIGKANVPFIWRWPSAAARNRSPG